jgi:CCR4-NOT transcriptional regulation complex NOT5 subunit
LTGAAIASAQRRYGTARGLVDRVQRNLRRAESFTPPNEKERERYHNAQHHLSEFDRRLEEGKFDKDKLDEAIDDVKNVVEHNTLSPEARDTLTRDLGELRELRRNRGQAY